MMDLIKLNELEQKHYGIFELKQEFHWSSETFMIKNMQMKDYFYDSYMIMYL